MALESATYIDDLNTANPAPTDLLAQGDDHIRLIKAVLQATFPNITGAVTPTQAELNLLDGAISVGVPIGIIATWYGSDVSVPTGWAICNGQTVARSDGGGNITTPDLRDKVVMGVGSVALVQGNTYGSANQSATSASGGDHTHATSGGGHSHPGLAVVGHALTLSQIPAHTHTVGVDHGNGSGGTGNTIESGQGSATATSTSSSAGSGTTHTHDLTWPATPDGSHSHTVETTGAHTHGVTVSVYQPAVALHRIMKV